MKNSSTSPTRILPLAIHLALGLCFGSTSWAAVPLEAWVQRFATDSTVLQEGRAVSFGPSGDVAATGLQFIGTNEAFYTAKYSGATGTLIWEKTYDSGNGDDIPASVVMDSQGHVIVTGYRTNNSGIHDFYTIKYSSASGAVIWARDYEGPNGGLDEAIKVVVDSADNVIVTGVSAGDGTQQDIQTLKYRASDGVTLNSWRYNSPNNRTDHPTDLAVDSSDNIVVVGEVNQGDEVWFYTGRYNGTGGAGAKIWEKVKSDLPSPSFYGALGVAVDSDGNVFTVGRIRRPDVTFESLTIKYSANNGTVLWDEFSGSIKLDNATDPIDIAVDSAGNAVVGATMDTTFGNAMYVVKYNGASGTVLWDTETAAPGDDDNLTAVAIGLEDDVIIAGTSRNNLAVGASDDYFVQKLLAADGSSLFSNRRNGDNESGEDTVSGLAVDAGGNFVVTGKSRKPPEVQGNTFQMLTVKFGEALIVSPFLLVTGDPAPGAGVVGSGVPAGSVFRVLNPPAIADTGDFAALVTIGPTPAKKLSGIIHQGNFAGLQGLPAPDVSDATFKTFKNPVISPNGRVAFEATVMGTPGPQKTGVWTTVFDGTLRCALQTGIPIAGLGNLSIKSVTGISVRNSHLLTLVKLSGTRVNGTNNVGLVGFTSLATPRLLLRTGDPLTIDNKTSTIKKISALVPAKAVGGHGRYHANPRTIARVELKDKRLAFVLVDHTGTVTPLLATGQSAAGVVAQTTWKNLSYPGINVDGNFVICAGTLTGTNVNASNDAVFASKPAAVDFDLNAREGDIAPDVTGAQPANGPVFATFFDPVSNDQNFCAFLATLRGPGVTGANNTGLWFGGLYGPLVLSVREGDFVPDSDGVLTTAKFQSFESLALPNGTSAAPLFMAKLSGPGVNGKNNLALWTVNTSNAKPKKIIGLGDIIGDAKITRMSVLQSLPGVAGESRSFNTPGGVGLLLILDGKTQAILLVDGRFP